MCWPTSHPRRGVSLASRRHFRAARIVWTFNVKAEKRRRQSKFRQMSRVEEEQKLVVLLVNQIAGNQPKRRALLRTQPLTDPPVIQPDGARHSRTLLCQASRRPAAMEEESGPTPRADTSSRQTCHFPQGFASPLGCNRRATGALNCGCQHALPFNHRVQPKRTHTLSRVLRVHAPQSAEGKTREGMSGDASRPGFAAIWPTTEASATHRRGTCWRIPLLEASFVFEPQWR